MMKKMLPALLCLLLPGTLTLAQSTATDETTLDSAALQALYLEKMAFLQDSIEGTLNYDTGSIALGDGIATLVVPAGYKYLNAGQSAYVLTELWGNPPSETMGMLFPDGVGVFDYDSYVIEISFAEMGYVDDKDVDDIDYDELLEGMQEDTRNENPGRTAQGYPAVELAGWASPPYYDEVNKKLHWAQELHFEGEEMSTLNYNIRILGRKGVMVLNFISDMNQLAQVQEDIPLILPAVNFNEGHQYSDFNPDIDQIAAVGIGGLIAGKVLAKAGFFAILAKFAKFIIAGLIGLGALARKFFTGRQA